MRQIPFSNLIVAGHAIIALSASPLPAQPLPTPRDSAGIRIFVVSAAARPLRLVETSPSLGGQRERPAEEFNARQPFFSAIRLSDGRVVVNDVQSIKYFAPDGKFLTEAGRSGPGPGEFTQIRKLCRLPGDSVLAQDYSGRRLSLWSPSGKFVREFRAAGRFISEPCWSDGHLLAAQLAPPNALGSLTGPTTTLSVVRRDGTIVRTLGTFPATSDNDVVRLRASIIASKSTFFVASARSADIKEYTNTGQLRAIWRIAFPSVPVSDSAWNAIIRGRSRSSGLKLQRPRFFPPFDHMLRDDLGRFWLQSAVEKDLWTLVGADGTTVGSVRLAGMRASPIGFHNAEVAVQFWDDDGAVAIRFYRVGAPSK